MDFPTLIDAIYVTLDHVGSTVCGQGYRMELQDDTPGQAWYAVVVETDPYGECFQVSDGNGGWTWMVYLEVPSGACQGTYAMPRVIPENDPTGAYAYLGWGATSADDNAGGDGLA